MSDNCPVDQLVKRLKIRYTPQDTDLDHVLEQVLEQYLVKRRTMDPAMAEAMWGPELEDCVGVLMHAIDHMRTVFHHMLMDRMLEVMERRGLPHHQTAATIAARLLQAELRDVMPDSEVHVHALPVDELEARLFALVGEEGLEMAKEVREAMAQEDTAQHLKKKEVLH